MSAARLEALALVGTVVHSHTEDARRVAFEEFGQARIERAYRLASLILGDREEAEDAVHDALVRAWLNWAKLRERDRLDAWFDRILVNECRARLRSRRIRPIQIPRDMSASNEGVFESISERDALRDALSRLDADHRIAVVLRYVSGLTPREISLVTHSREGTVKSRLHYALREFRSALDAGDRERVPR